MALLGHVESTALNGSDAPVFEKAGVAIEYAVQQTKTDIERKLEAQGEQINALTNALTAFLNAQGQAANVPVETGAGAEPELTPAEKAAITRAANKAKAEAEAADGEA